ncbi:MAG: laccase domain-containing protein, partial [Akkermansiaceae bacterium]|nr:laccase domain-containing protein [Akkermansiaceae bacterium]
MTHTVTEAFSFLDSINELPGIRAHWVERIDGIDVDCNRDGAMRNLRENHQAQVESFAGTAARWWRAEQVHGQQVAEVPTPSEITAPDGLPVVPAVDGMITAVAGQVLSIYVADCGAIWLADKRTRAIGLLHSGKKGTEYNILNEAVELMTQRF